MDLRSLADQPFALLLELERRARASISDVGGDGAAGEEWVGIAFRIGSDSFVAGRSDVREVMPLPEKMTRVPGARPWLRGVTNVRGQLLTIVDLRGFLGAGGVAADRQARVLVIASRDVPTGVLVDQVFGFRRFSVDEFVVQAPTPELRCEQYLRGAYRRGAEAWPRFDFSALLEDENFLNAGEGS
ncbi:MAG: chemotaxis protein CheW [Gammaproteobacteria bacterium]